MGGKRRELRRGLVERDQLPDVTGFPAGAGTGYDPVLVAQIIQRVAVGETLTAICREPGMPTIATARKWFVTYPELRTAFDQARRLKATSLFDEALDLARKTNAESKSYTPAEVNAKRLVVETLKWGAAKLNPQEYGDRQPSNPTIAIQINTGLDLAASPLEQTEDNTIFSFTATLPAPEASTGPEQPREPVSKRRNRRPGARPMKEVEAIDVEFSA